MIVTQYFWQAIDEWDRFWFRTDGRAQMRLLRIGLSIMLLLNYSIRSLDLELFFLPTGIGALDAWGELMDMTFRFSFLRWFPGTTGLWITNFALLASLLTLAFGIRPRLSAIVALAMHVSFLHRNSTVHYGMDLIATFYLLFFCMADFRDKKPEKEDWQSILGSVAFRLAQIQICVVYAFSGLHKLKGINWWRGEAIWGVLANPQYARFDFTWMAKYPLLVIASTYGTMLWELYFPVLIWVRKIRYPLLVGGVFLHVGIAVAMNLNYFGTLMLLIYSVFLDESHARWVLDTVKKVISPTKVSRAPAEEYSV